MKRRGFLATVLGTVAAAVVGKKVVEELATDRDLVREVNIDLRKNPLTEKDAYKWEDPFRQKLITGKVMAVKKVDRHTYHVRIVVDERRGSLHNHLVIFGSSMRTGFVTNHYKVWNASDGYKREDYDEFVIKATSTRARLRINTNDTVVFFASAMKESATYPDAETHYVTLA